MASRISVVVPTYQRCASVKRLLDALARQTLPHDQYEVVLSIDGSEDGTREMAATYSVPYRLQTLWQPNRGRAGACNTGIKAATGDLIVLLDDDMEPAPGFLAGHLSAHAAAPRRGVVGAAPIPVDPSSPPIVAFTAAKFNGHLEKLAEPGHRLGFREFYSGNFSIAKGVLQEVGLFDEDFKIYGNEDGELALRLLAADVQLVYSPDAVAQQHYLKDFAALARDNLAKGRTAVLLAGKQRDTFHALKLSSYREGSRKWRLLRAALLGATQVWMGVPTRVIRFVEWLERWRPARLHLYYDLVLDYFYWFGAKAAMRENRAVGRGLTSLTPPSSTAR